MTHDTFENLMRILEKRIRQNTTAGRWAEVAEAIAEKHALIARFYAESKGNAK